MPNEIFSGLISALVGAVVVYLVCFGAVYPILKASNFGKETSASEFNSRLQFGILTSLYFSFTANLLLYTFSMSSNIYLWVIFLLNLSAILIIRKEPSQKTKRALLKSIYLPFAVFAFFAVYSLSSTPPFYHAWDGIVSWYRWSLEIYERSYEPYNAFYPVFWPTMWSYLGLVGDQAYQEFYSRILSCFSVLILFLTFRLEENSPSWRVLLFVINLAILYHILSDHLLSGYQDGLVALWWVAVILQAGNVIIAATKGTSQLELDFLSLSLMVACGVVMKQAGFPLLGVLFITIAITQIWQITSKSVLTFALLLPMLSLAVNIYIYNISADFGLNEIAKTLSAIVDDSRGDTSQLIFALDKLPALSLIFPTLLLLMCIISRRLGSEIRLFLILILLLLFGGFLVYSECCSYGERNAFWISSGIVGSALLAIKNLSWKQ